MSDFITTYSKINFTPLEPDINEIEIKDIAHSLSLLCRANGHYEKFYSVGAHCINCYDEAVSRRESLRVQLACLLHDATEAYMSDVTRTVKKNLPDYQVFEENLADMIYKKYLGSSLTDYEKYAVKSIDDALLYYEFYEFTAVKLFDEPPYIAATPDFFQGDFGRVEKNFLNIFKELSEKLKEEEKNRNPVIKIPLLRAAQ